MAHLANKIISLLYLPGKVTEPPIYLLYDFLLCACVISCDSHLVL